MKSADVKKGLRVVVTHKSSIHRGKFGTITSVHLKDKSKNVDFVMVKFESGKHNTAAFSVGSIQLADGVPDVKKPAIPYNVGDLIEPVSPNRISGRKVGDVYKVIETNGLCTKFTYVSGAKPNIGWETGTLSHSNMYKYWKPHVKATEKRAVTPLPTKPYAGMYLRSLTDAARNRRVGDILQIEKVLDSGGFYYINITKERRAVSVVAERYNDKHFQFVHESEIGMV